MPYPKGVDIEEFKKTKLDPIRLRVFNMLKAWVSTYTYDFFEDEALVETMLEFVNNTMIPTGTHADIYLLGFFNTLSLRHPGMDMAGTQLAKLITKKMEDRGKEANKELQFSTPPPRPILPMNLGTAIVSVVDYDPLEVSILSTFVVICI